MALPVILPYPMPEEQDLPVNKVAWTPDANRAVLLIHDMQKYFVNAFSAHESPVVELLANIQRLRAECAKLGIPVVFSAQPGGQTPAERGLLQDFWGSGIDGGPDQKQIVPELAPAPGDILLTKWRYSAFQKTNLSEIIRGYGRDQLIVCGIYAHIGCLLTSCEAFMQDIQCFFAADAVADFSLEKHRMALAYAAERCAVTATTQGLLDGLRKGEADKVYSSEPEGSTEELGKTSSPSAQPLTQEAVRQQVAELLQESPSDIGDGDDLVNWWGLDSVRIMSLAERWRRSGVEITFVELAERPTLADWWRLLLSGRQRAVPNADYYAG
jgi:bifunctional isochorismate lyase / aryl carrier protein